MGLLLLQLPTHDCRQLSCCIGDAIFDCPHWSLAIAMTNAFARFTRHCTFFQLYIFSAMSFYSSLEHPTTTTPCNKFSSSHWKIQSTKEKIGDCSNLSLAHCSLIQIYIQYILSRERGWALCMPAVELICIIYIHIYIYLRWNRLTEWRRKKKEYREALEIRRRMTHAQEKLIERLGLHARSAHFN